MTTVARQRARRTGSEPAIVRPGRNCWRVERAGEFLCIQDAADYFRLVRDALLNARKTVFILGWDIFAGIDLLPAGPGRRARRDTADAPTRLGHLLDYIARRRRNLRCYILIWDYAALFTLQRDPWSRWRLGWRTHRHVRFGFDDRHPLGGSHHQKIVVVDDALAFCGGIDLTAHRWDTPAHRVEEPARVNGVGIPHGPYHEVQVMVSGPAASSLGELARERWRVLGEKRIPPINRSAGDLWPADVRPDLTNVDVAIARTIPGSATEPPVRECEALFLDSIALAKRSIYIESQYFTNTTLGAAIGARLRERKGPEVIVVTPADCAGWLEQSTMGAFRNEVLRQVIAADTHKRLRLVYPAASQSRQVPIFVHSKVMIVDDTLVRIGSANLSRRSMGVDTECDLAVEARGRSRARADIRRIRDRLLAEHLALPAEVVAAALDTSSLRALIDAQANAEHTLVRLALPPEDAAQTSDTLRAVADPDEPIAYGPTLTELLPPVEASRAPFPVLVPLELLVFAAGLAFGAVNGILIALLGSLAAAVAGYAIGRAMGARRLMRWTSRRSYRSIRQLGASDVMGVAVLRLASVASAGSVHLLCGAGRVPFARYLLGTAIGLTPMTAALAGLGALVRQTLVDPSIAGAVLTGAAALAVAAAIAMLRTIVLVRQFAPSVSNQRARAEFG